jgi:uncharacterized protein (DUF2164 family)
VHERDVCLEEARRKRVVVKLQALYRDQFDEELSAFRADQLLDFLIAAVGPQIYNQAVQDARKYMQQKLDDLDAEIHEPDEG